MNYRKSRRECEDKISQCFSKFDKSAINLGFTKTYFNAIKTKKGTNNKFAKNSFNHKLQKTHRHSHISQNLSGETDAFTKSHSEKKKISTSLSRRTPVIPHRSITQEKLQVNPAITQRDFYIKIVKPSSKDSRQQQHNTHQKITKVSNKNSIVSQKSSISLMGESIRSKDSKLSKKITPRTKQYQRQMTMIKSYICDDQIAERLIKFSHKKNTSQQKSKNTLRVYKEDVRKIFIDRYGKDRVSTYLDLQYIIDFSEMKQIFEEIVQFTKEEVLMLVFLILDIDRNGIITTEDLTALNGLSTSEIKTNLMIQEDLSTIITYIKKKKAAGDPVIDNISESQILKQDSLTIMKFRKYNFELKKRENLRKQRPKSIITKNIHDHLFTLREEKSSTKNKAKFSLKSIIEFSKVITQCQEIHQFAINFDRFGEIFTQIPKTFYDILYVLGGLQIPGFYYSPVDWKSLNPQIHHTNKQLDSIEINRFEVELKSIKEVTKSLKMMKW